jgi:transposase
MSRSTMNDLFHRMAQVLTPLHKAHLRMIAQRSVVLADETPMRMQQRKKRAYLWTFRADKLIAYVFSKSRSGETPRSVLGGTRGVLVVDGYTGYNTVLDVDGRVRAGCLAHVRRKFFDATQTAPEEVKSVLAIILELYRIEHQANDLGIVGTEQHAQMRSTQGRPVMAKLLRTLRAQRGVHVPKCPFGMALSHALRNWRALTLYLRHPQVPIDNNASERALRVVALGRKNFLFVGDVEAGENLAVLYSLVSTCEALGINPQTYLADVLMRVQSHPQSRIDELLPQNWAAGAS